MNNVILPQGARPLCELYPNKQKELEKLPKQQYAVALLILEAKTNKEIGNLLFLSSGTISNIISKIYKKTKVSKRADFIIKYSYIGQ